MALTGNSIQETYKLKTLKVAKFKDEGWWWRWWWRLWWRWWMIDFKLLERFWWWTNGKTDICDCWGAFVAENVKCDFVLKHCFELHCQDVFLPRPPSSFPVSVWAWLSKLLQSWSLYTSHSTNTIGHKLSSTKIIQIQSILGELWRFGKNMKSAFSMSS